MFKLDMRAHTVWLSAVLLLVAVPSTARRIDAAHDFDLSDVKVGDLIDKLLPSLDISKPLYELGKLVNRGGQAVSPGLEKAGIISTSAGIALINVGSLLTASSRALSKEGPIGGNPNFINEAVAGMLLRRKASNSYQPRQLSLAELAQRYNSPPHRLV